MMAIEVVGLSDPNTSATNLLALGLFQDDRSTAGMFDPVLATLEVYPLPAETLERVQTRTGCP